MLPVFLPDLRIDAVGDDDQVGIREFLQILGFLLKNQFHAQFPAAIVQDVEQRDARAAAEAVAAGAHGAPLVDHVDVAPVGEAAADHLVGRHVVGLERIQRLVGNTTPKPKVSSGRLRS